MLEKLSIKNVALIEEADIEFDDRLNVLSGETGSGKSVILDSINFVLGSKADKSMIRHGETEALVKAEFSIDENSPVIGILEEMDIEADGMIIISRKFSTDGKSVIKVNGNAVTSVMLKKIAAHLVDVHGQSEHFFLLSENNQLTVIDSLSPLISDLKSQLNEQLLYKKQLNEAILRLGGSEQEREQKLDILSYQINELQNADVKVGEIEALKAKKRIYDNAEKVLGVINSISGIFSEDNGCIDLLSAARRQAASISDIDGEYEKLYERLEELSVEAQDLSETVSDIADSFSFDEREAGAVEARLSLLKNLLKKYGEDEEHVISFLDNAKKQYDELYDAAAELDKINAKIIDTDNKIYKICKKLTQARQAESKQFCLNVESQLKSLNIPNAKFFVEFNGYTPDNICVNSSGADRISFMFSANKGEPAKPLSKVISGGEMSRFMLAIKTVLKGLNGISTYIFDEIDAGISGVTALSVADKFISISKNTQIIAVSHLPQICAAATSQFLIFKIDENNQKTLTKIKKLNDEDRVNEIVRLTGSIASEAAILHAKELLKHYEN